MATYYVEPPSTIEQFAEAVIKATRPGTDDFTERVNNYLADLGDLLVAKNKAYGDSALNPIRVFSKASAEEQLLVRIDDKISRIARGHDYADEDTVKDLCGYLVLLHLAREDSE